MQFRFRVSAWHVPSSEWYVGPWCDWKDLHDGYTFTIGDAANLQFRERPKRGATPDFCPCGYMDKGTCGPQLCPQRERSAEREGSAAS